MNLDVLIPSLLFPASASQATSPPHVPVIERLLARSDRRVDKIPAGSSWLCNQWGLHPPYPFAALLAESDGFDTSVDAWMFAEPVHLLPDRDRLMMFSSSYLDVTTSESSDLVASLNSHFSDRQLVFMAPPATSTSKRWYVRFAQSEIPETTSPNNAQMGSLVDFQPDSRGTLNWRSLQNEAQMLFYDHPVNRAREATGKLLISGVWFWGGGIKPKPAKPAYDLVVTHSTLATQLAKIVALDVRRPPWAPSQPSGVNVLAIIESGNEFAAQLFSPAAKEELETFESEWFQPISQALAAGKIQRLRIFVPGSDLLQTFQLTRRKQLLRFWRHAKAISSYA